VKEEAAQLEVLTTDGAFLKEIAFEEEVAQLAVIQEVA
jgi:hypothetical protein